MSNTATLPTLNVHTLVALASLADACQRNAPCVFLFDGVPLQVTARALVKSPSYPSFLSSDDDVREAFVWFSGVVEHFLPVSDLLDRLRDGTLALDYTL